MKADFQICHLISKFIDERGPKNILTPDEYYILQKKVLEVSPKNSRDEKSNLPSIRKEINQFVKFNNFTLRPVANYKGEIYSLPFNMWTFNKLWNIYHLMKWRIVYYVQIYKI
jgi:hypothetical protein